MKDFYAVFRQDTDSESPEFKILQHIKPVFDLDRARLLCDTTAQNGTTSEDYAVYHITAHGAQMVHRTPGDKET